MGRATSACHLDAMEMTRHGLRRTLGAVVKRPAGALGLHVGLMDSRRATPGRPDAVLNLQPGELIEVKTFDDIRDRM